LRRKDFTGIGFLAADFGGNRRLDFAAFFVIIKELKFKMDSINFLSRFARIVRGFLQK
jgi:hypothetical protein